MSIHATVFGAALLLVGATLFGSPLQAQGACESQAQRVQCSEQCCGRKSCTPSCESDCVRACVTACKDPSKSAVFSSQLRAYQHRCGNRSL
jgi:hypothetical protein